MKLKAIEAGEREVEDEAVWNSGSRCGKKFARGRESLRLQTFVTDQQFQGFAHGDIVIDNVHDRFGARRGAVPANDEEVCVPMSFHILQGCASVVYNSIHMNSGFEFKEGFIEQFS